MSRLSIACTTAFLLAAIVPPGPLRAEGRTGIGIVFGEPTGVAWKYTIDPDHALDGAIGLTPYDRFRIHVDYLWESYPFENGNLLLHYGAGGAIGFRETELRRDGRSYLVSESGVGFGVRAVLGLTYRIPRAPVDLFLEVAPVIVLAPGAGIGFDAGFGARVYP
jgi:hypothetical protein